MAITSESAALTESDFKVEASPAGSYRDRVVTALVAFSIIWSLLGIGMHIPAAGRTARRSLRHGGRRAHCGGTCMAEPRFRPGVAVLRPPSFGRLRSLHTNAVIFGFGVSALMGTAFYSVQRTCHVPLFAPGLAWFCCFGWQIGVLGGGASLLAG